jgi:acetyltransferase-like isoleucine patch superfamily enzyme
MSPFKLHIIRFFIFFIPETRGFNIKRFLYRWAGAIIGKNVQICSSVFILGSGKLYIGDNTWIGHKVIIIASSIVQIGRNVDIAPGVYIGNGTHEIEPNSQHIAGKGKSIKITIGDGSWLGVNSTILPGVSTGKKVIVAAGSLVNCYITSYTVVAGIPAKPMKKWDLKNEVWIRC